MYQVFIRVDTSFQIYDVYNPMFNAPFFFSFEDVCLFELITQKMVPVILSSERADDRVVFILFAMFNEILIVPKFILYRRNH